MRKGKPTYSDFQYGTSKELMKTYKLDNKGLEQAHRRLMYGAGQKDFQSEYNKFYDSRRSK